MSPLSFLRLRLWRWAPSYALAAVVLAPLQAGASSLASPGLSFAQALEQALHHPPTLIAAQARLDAARAAALSAGERPDPQLRFGIENLPINGMDRFALTRDSMTMRRIGVMQELPNAAKRAAWRDRADAQTLRTQAELQSARVLAQREVALAWLQRHHLERQLSALEKLEAENHLLLQTTQAQLAAGRAMVEDALMPRREALMLAERRDELHAQRAVAHATLKRWIGAAADAELSGPPPTWTPNADTLHGTLADHPELRAASAMQAEAQAERREADAMRKPDWSVEVVLQKRGPAYDDMVSIMVSLDLPLFPRNRQDAQVRAREALLRATAADLDAMRREHEAELAMGLAEQQRAHTALRRQRDEALPLAQQRSQIALDAYRSGNGPLRAVLSARRELLEAELKALALESERDQWAARLMLTREWTGAQP
ncbi:TolC family protein [Inhella gelatinilytica]|uniref:TolC family protein n=1 Tax=Inhella gelatinilytica TaxID=2795030 RepID=A0A931ND51_9BURK|nr:TolC family protein [Inhella gelatinilytica]MBH9552722.1 TolC family protein [Inhella gelatinilytica]